MKDLKMVSVMTIVSLTLFYIAASLIEGTFVITNMSKDIRQIIFGLWLGVLVFGILIYFLSKYGNKE